MANLNWKKIKRYFVGTNISTLFASILSLLLILFIIYNWNEISVLQIGNNYVKKMDKTKKEVLDTATSIQRISKEIKQQKKELEKLSSSLTIRTLKQNLINDIIDASVSLGFDGIGAGNKAIVLVTHYKAHHSKTILTEYLMKEHFYNKTIANDINKLEEFLTTNKESGV